MVNEMEINIGGSHACRQPLNQLRHRKKRLVLEKNEGFPSKPFPGNAVNTVVFACFLLFSVQAATIQFCWNLLYCVRYVLSKQRKKHCFLKAEETK